MRDSFFLVAETLLIVAFSELYTHAAPAATIAGAGFLLTIIWLYAAARMRFGRHEREPTNTESGTGFRGDHPSATGVAHEGTLIGGGLRARHAGDPLRALDRARHRHAALLVAPLPRRCQSTSAWAVSQKAVTRRTEASRSSGWQASTTWWT